MEFLDKNGLRTLWAQINNLVNSSSGGGSSIALPLVNLQNIADFPYSSTFTDEQANTLEHQVASAIGFTYTESNGLNYHVTCYLVKYDSTHNQYKWRYEDSSVVFEIVSVLSRTSGDVWATKDFTITKSIPSSGGGTSDIPTLDLGEISSIGSSVALTSDQVSWINANYDKISAVKFQDTTESGGTLPLLLSNGSYQQRQLYYSGIYLNTIYSIMFDMDTNGGSATSGTYYITKTELGSGGSSSEPVEQETLFSGQYNTWYSGDTTSQSFNLDTSTAGLTHSKVETLEFILSIYSQTGSDSYSGTVQIGINELYNLYNAGTVGSMNSLKLFGGKLELNIDSISVSYDQGTLNYSISARLSPNWNYITQDYAASVSTGFTYKGFKFANGSSY